MRMPAFAVAGCSLLLVSQARAQRQVDQRPEQVMRAFLEAVQHERWIEAAQFLETTPIEKQRQQMLESLRRPRPEWRPTLESIMKSDPEMPRAVAEYQLRRMEREQQRFERDYRFWGFAGVGDSATLAKMPPLEAAARWLEAQDFRYMIREAQRSRPECEGIADSLVLPAWHPRELLGVIQRGDTAYAVHREGMRGPDGKPTFEPFRPLMVATLYRRGRVWRIRPEHDLLSPGMGSSFVCTVVSDTVRTDTLRTIKKH